jgi:excinuclease ABC subunit A
VGLEYVTLGQPVPTLSGGEAQRLKLAGHLAEAGSVLSSTTHKGKLFLFDEPTTGLHFQDVAKLLTAFRKLLAAGHSLLVIEHNLDVIRASDWIIDLGPEGGERGGRIVCAGAPDEIRAHPDSHTGRALADYARAVSGEPTLADAAPLAVREPMPAYESSGRKVNGRASNSVVIHNAREHNLKSIDVQIPRDRLTVITGVSGSGKSTLAFDILFNEGQRRYLESLNAYARQFVQPAARPDVDAIFGIPPTVAIEQRTSRGGRKSTVATLTEIYHFLRLLYVKLGTQHCPDCAVAIESQSAASIAARLLREYKGKRIALLAPLVVARKGAMAAPVAFQGAHDRASRGGDRCRCQDRHRIAPGARARARLRQGAGPRVGSEAGSADGLLDQARLPFLRAQLRGARPAPLLLQLQARLVRELLWHGSGNAGGGG